MISRYTLAALCALVTANGHAQNPIPPAPTVDARAYVLIESKTGKVLASKDPQTRVEPASLTKLMTSYIVFEELASGKLKLDESTTVSEHAWKSEGSRTFIDVGKPVPIQILIMGMIVQSGNDATIALAERIAGTEETFARMMNDRAKRLGMSGTHFDNSSGLPSPTHYTTANDLSLLANAIVRDYPQYYRWYSVREFEYNGIKQQNRNGLLGKDPSVDGMKTGHTDAAGYCLVSSALRDGMRLLSVVVGSNSMKTREDASAALLNYGFNFYETKLIAKGGAKLGSANFWKAANTPVDVGIARDLYLTLPRGQAPALKTSIEIQPRLIAPARLDSTLGAFRVQLNGQTLATEALHPLKPVELGGWWRRMVDSAKLWFN